MDFFSSTLDELIINFCSSITRNHKSTWEDVKNIIININSPLYMQVHVSCTLWSVLEPSITENILFQYGRYTLKDYSHMQILRI